MPDRHGPMRTGRFTVEIDDVEVEGWREVTIPGSATEEGQYRDGDDPDYEKKLWGQTTWDDLEMERGVQPGDSRIYDWREEVIQGRVDEGRKEVTITLLDEAGEPLIRWGFQNAWLKAYDPPTLDASGDSDVATENVTVSFDGMTADWDPEPEVALQSRFSITPTDVVVGEEITVDGSNSEPADVDNFEWDFDDGTTATGETATHTFEESGVYSIELTVTHDGETSSHTRDWYIQPEQDNAGEETDDEGVAPGEHESGVSQALFDAVDADGDGDLTLEELREAIDEWQDDGEIDDVDATLAELRELVEWWKAQH